MTALKSTIKVMLLDDHELIRKGMEVMLSQIDDIELMGSYGKSAYLFQEISKTQPDIMLLDLSLPDMGGDIVASRLLNSYPELKIIILTSNPSSYTAKQLLQIGVKGYLFKNLEQHLLVSAVKSVYEGHTYISPELQTKFMNFSKELKKDINEVEDLTAREIEIIKLIVQEYTSQEIADELQLSHRTIENYRLALMQKLGAKNMIGLVKRALMLGLGES